MFKCIKGVHEWPTLQEADRCCNGSTYVLVPLNYGWEIFGRSPSRVVCPNARGWKPWLIPDSEVEEIKRIRSLTPHSLLSSTESNPWLDTQQ